MKVPGTLQNVWAWILLVVGVLLPLVGLANIAAGIWGGQPPRLILIGLFNVILGGLLISRWRQLRAKRMASSASSTR